MRSYIFTEKEKEAISALLNSEDLPPLKVARLKHRIKTFKTLESDVQLYLKISKKFNQS
jgi:hypothetical protein